MRAWASTACTRPRCAPPRASLLTGRNHHRIGNGQIAELANDWDGYAGEIPRSSALCAEVLKHYGYATGAWGKWHNTPALETTAAGPFHNWPSEIGFEYFYGFLADEASQYERGCGAGQRAAAVQRNNCLDIGSCLGGPVSLDYDDRAPFPLEGTIRSMTVRYTS
jgi:arylsulfatase A-like enzyme